ncbi:MAG: transcriptional regulator [Thermoprotei archaeon]|nr:MAG: transcriptional regulator [Thermoprotei archaeon]
MSKEEDDVAKEILKLDPILRHPVRFSILTILVVSGYRTEGELAKSLRISWGRLSTHISKLEEEGYVKTRRHFTLYGPRTFVEITDKGVKAYYKYVETLENILKLLKKR